jgi:branched-chain amino acid transport system ATP-binding protein
MTVYENVLVGATFGGDQEAHPASLEALELARALATGPRVLLLDEVAGGLTKPEVHQLVATIRRVRQAGVSIVWIEHIVHALLSVADRRSTTWPASTATSRPCSTCRCGSPRGRRWP